MQREGVQAIESLTILLQTLLVNLVIFIVDKHSRSQSMNFPNPNGAFAPFAFAFNLPHANNNNSDPEPPVESLGALSLSENSDAGTFRPVQDIDRRNWTVSVHDQPFESLPTFRQAIRRVEHLHPRIIDSPFINKMKHRAISNYEVMQFMMARKELYAIAEQEPLLDRLGGDYGIDQPILWRCLPRTCVASEDIQRLRQITPDCQLKPYLQEVITGYRRSFETIKGIPVLVMAHYFVLYGAQLVGGHPMKMLFSINESVKFVQSFNIFWERTGIDQPTALEHISLLVDRVVADHEAIYRVSIKERFFQEVEQTYKTYIGLFEGASDLNDNTSH
ncbi:hypothetical protein [Parendozoicomonas haliclonae]|uniref:Heme oxygenase n=1 Tax=Parendozoicomonas haliclonae TaxID=1960125 RepID=A0A1X7AL27_9GAMM|nr:hypothetical protein [Parendozoicomonas haliclonae]SMA47924.1 hypothetical protein EHSB41UT_02604 [Parendozoicomonas haliclonae]